MTYFTSDLHFGHENIIKFCNRPYVNAEQMNKDLIKNINETVKQEDTLYILGDFAFMQESEIIKILKQIHCKNLHFIDGNHDKKMRNDTVKKFFKSYDHYKEVSIEGSHLILFHFALLEWNAGHRGAIMLHGHSHGTMNYPPVLQDKRIMDVGVDCHNYKPISIIDIQRMMKNKVNYAYGES